MIPTMFANNLVTHIHTELEAAERKAVLDVVLEHPEWTLGQLAATDGPYAKALRTLTIGELLRAPEAPGETVDATRLVRAQRSEGDDFDAIVLEVIAEAGDRVGASYLRARVGGPRWKLQASVRRLVDRKLIHREGTTSATRYWVGARE
jgi:hypothetical protein